MGQACKRHAAGAQKLPRDQVLRHTNADGLQPRRRHGRDPFVLGQDQRQRPREESLDQFRGGLRYSTRELFELNEIEDVRDQRVVGGTLFRDEYFIDGFFVEDVRAQTINGLGRERDNFAALDEARGD